MFSFEPNPKSIVEVVQNFNAAGLRNRYMIIDCNNGILDMPGIINPNMTRDTVASICDGSLLRNDPLTYTRDLFPIRRSRSQSRTRSRSRSGHDVAQIDGNNGSETEMDTETQTQDDMNVDIDNVPGFAYIFFAGAGDVHRTALISMEGFGASFVKGVWRGGVNHTQSANVSIVRVDDVIPSTYDVFWFKIDTQGFELNVMHGSANVLNSGRVLMFSFEVWPRGLTANGVTVREVVQFVVRHTCMTHCWPIDYEQFGAINYMNYSSSAVGNEAAVESFLEHIQRRVYQWRKTKWGWFGELFCVP